MTLPRVGAMLLLSYVAVSLAASVAVGDEMRVRPPQFDSGYTLPETPAPEPRGNAWDYADLAVLAAGIGAASWLVLRKRSRRWIVALTVFSLLYFGFWRVGCVCSVGAVQNVSRGLCDATYAVGAVTLGFFAVPLVATLFTGRTFCAAVCPLGAVQELVAVRPVRIPLWLEHSLGLIPYVYLAGAVLFAATGSAYVICRADPFVSLFRVLPVGDWVRSPANAGWWAGPAAIAGKVSLLLPAAAFLAVGVFVARPYCRFVCPLGAVFRPLSSLSKWHATITPSDCVQCRLCENACPYNAIRKPTGPSLAATAPDRRRLGAMLALLPLLVAGGGALGWAVSGQLARVDYTVQQALAVRAAEDAPPPTPDNPADDRVTAFATTGTPAGKLYADARTVEARYAVTAALAGAFVGLVIALKLISLSVHRRRNDYEPDRARCFSCGRCFEYCPVERHTRQTGSPPEIVGRSEQS
jgi:ferredoxin